jgi:hypothetical protein
MARLSKAARSLLIKILKDVAIYSYRPLKPFEELRRVGYNLQMESERHGSRWTTYVFFLGKR